uniref:NADH-ubiquinone oxidoreductase chain 3 n=1 Tax=Curculionoidea sp. 31 KM-2017 TaxID=2219416 RepID=A0A346RJC9_9CUCU|nr:NADH dehydrogenase subunit 3 [Curculionoidea sp. 31 KM-2017]
MKMNFLLALMIMMLILIILTLLNLTSKKSLKDREKISPFECGFDPKNSARMPFSLQFFLIAVIFVIFDVELTLLLPMILVYKISNLWNFSLTTFTFITILILGIFHEQAQGALNWMK